MTWILSAVFGLRNLVSGLWTFFCTPLGQKVALVLIAGALLWGAHWLGVNQGRADRDKHWTPIVAAARADLGTCHASEAKLLSAIARQNAAIGLLRADSDRRAALGDKAAQQARVAAQAASARAGAIMAAKPGPDLCKAAFELVRESVR